MKYGLLGPLEVVDADRTIEIGARKQRAVLAMLLIDANHVMSVDRLIDQLWGDAPPAQATAALQMYISSLRRTLEPDRAPRTPAQVLVSRPPGYLLVVDPEHLDVARFESLLASGQTLLAQGRAAAARVVLDTALGLWRGPALAEFAYEPFAEAAAHRLEALRLVAYEARVDADLALGRHAAAVAELEQMVALHPLRERLWASLMVALYRDGRQGDALRAYQQCRSVLAEELGIEPSPELRDLEGAVLRQDSSLVGQPPVAAPPAVATGEPSAPAAAGSVAGSALVGRAAPLARLRALWARTLDGRGGVALVTGEAGSGKTRLMEELCRHVTADGGTVAWGPCYERAGAPAFWPWMQVFRAAMSDRSPSDVDTLLDAAGTSRSELAPLLPEFAGDGGTPLPVTEPAEARFRLFVAASAFLSAIVVARPLAVLLDDLHWADVDSLQLLEFLTPRPLNGRLLVVGGYREDEVGHADPLAGTLAALARQPATERLNLVGLSAPEVGRFLAGATGTEPNPAVVAAAHARTEGNPFFLIELMRLLQSEGSLDDPVAVERSEVPAGVRDVIRCRLARLPEQTNAVLSVAAVVGYDFDLRVLGAASTLGEESTYEAIEVALIAGILVDSPGRPGRYRFAHALIRDTFYQGLNRVRRAGLHGRVAAVVEAMHEVADGAVAAELANHFFQAASVIGPEKGREWSLRAADTAIASLAFEAAESHLGRALSLVRTMAAGPERDRLELETLMSFGVQATMTKGWGTPELDATWRRAHELCRRSGDRTRLFGALYGLFYAAHMAAERTTAMRLADELMTVARTGADPALLVGAHYAAGEVAFRLTGDLREAEQHFSAAAAHGEKVGPEAFAIYPVHPVVLAKSMLAGVHSMLGQSEHAWALDRAIAGEADALGHPFTRLSSLITTMLLATMERRVDLVARTSDELAAAAGEYGFAQFAKLAALYQGWAQAHTGDAGEAVAGMQAALTWLKAAGWRVMLDLHLAMLAEAQRQAGRLGDALATAEGGLAEVQAIGQHYWEAELHRLCGELLVAVYPDRLEEADERVRQAVAVARRQGAVTLQRRAEVTLNELAAVASRL